MPYIFIIVKFWKQPNMRIKENDGSVRKGYHVCKEFVIIWGIITEKKICKIVHIVEISNYVNTLKIYERVQKNVSLSVHWVIW